MEPNVLDYHKSIYHELEALKNRVRNLIGSAHWPSDGTHKEAIVKRILKSHISGQCNVCSGFICYPEKESSNITVSNQIDVLLVRSASPTLFKDGEFVIVPPSAVMGVIEVKTKLQNERLKDAIEKLANEKERLNYSHNVGCLVGLFMYEDCGMSDEVILQYLQDVSRGEKHRSIDLFSSGPSKFIKYWLTGSLVGSPISEAVWHSYEIKELAPAYFLYNYIFSASKIITGVEDKLLFPIDGTKERYRKYYCAVRRGQPEKFKDG